MPADRTAAPAGEPGFADYLKAAFNVRVPVKGLGGLPLNWLYLAGVAGMSLAAPPIALFGLAGEIILLATLSTSGRFQNAVRARLLARHEDDVADALDGLVAQLSSESRRRYEQFAARCGEVLQIAQRLGHGSEVELGTYTTYLAQLQQVYSRMLVFSDVLGSYSRDWSKTDPQPEITRIEQEIAAGALPEQVKASRQATLELLKKRQESRGQLAGRVSLLNAEIERLDQQVALLRDQALLTQDPAALSATMDSAAGVLEEHNRWLQENAGFLQSLNQVSGGGM